MNGINRVMISFKVCVLTIRIGDVVSHHAAGPVANFELNRRLLLIPGCVILDRASRKRTRPLAHAKNLPAAWATDVPV